MWYAVGVWTATRTRLSPEQFLESVRAADAVLEMNPPFSKVTKEIPHFGPCSYSKCLAIVSVAICQRAITEHVDSPFLAAARDAKILADLQKDEP